MLTGLATIEEQYAELFSRLIFLPISTVDEVVAISNVYNELLTPGAMQINNLKAISVSIKKANHYSGLILDEDYI